MAKVLFNTQNSDLKISIYPRYVVRGARYDQGSV